MTLWSSAQCACLYLMKASRSMIICRFEWRNCFSQSSRINMTWNSSFLVPFDSITAQLCAFMTLQNVPYRRASNYLQIETPLLIGNYLTSWTMSHRCCSQATAIPAHEFNHAIFQIHSSLIFIHVEFLAEFTPISQRSPIVAPLRRPDHRNSLHTSLHHHTYQVDRCLSCFGASQSRICFDCCGSYWGCHPNACSRFDIRL